MFAKNVRKNQLLFITSSLSTSVLVILSEKNNSFKIVKSGMFILEELYKYNNRITHTLVLTLHPFTYIYTPLLKTFH